MFCRLFLFQFFFFLFSPLFCLIFDLRLLISLSFSCYVLKLCVIHSDMKESEGINKVILCKRYFYFLIEQFLLYLRYRDRQQSSHEMAQHAYIRPKSLYSNILSIIVEIWVISCHEV